MRPAKQTRRVLLASIPLLLLAGCGRKGALELPEAQEKPTRPASPPPRSAVTSPRQALDLERDPAA